MYWDALAEVAGERLDDLRRDHAEGTKDTWEPLVHAMATQGLVLTQHVDDKGLTRVTLTLKLERTRPMLGRDSQTVGAAHGVADEVGPHP